MSTHEVKIIKIKNIFDHPNADKLDIVQVWGYNCIVRKGQFKVGDLAAYIEPDYLVDVTRPEFNFLPAPSNGKTEKRITVSKFRGVQSYGLLINAPVGASEGDNVIDLLGVKRWEPPVNPKLRGALAEKGPEFIVPKYDLENFKRYSEVITKDDDVILTGKIHGSSARYVWHADRFWCGSRTQWKVPPGRYIPGYKEGKEPTEECAWWMTARLNPWIEEWCKKNPDTVLYGEMFGPHVQGQHFHYGIPKNSFGFAVFDIFEKGNWLNNIVFKQDRFKGLQFVETLYEGKFNLDVVKNLAEQKETFNNCGHIREGVVIKLQTERIDPNLGRIALKWVSDQYYNKSK